jgi:cephalosporin hydroxylase
MLEARLNEPLKVILTDIQQRIMTKNRYFGIPTLKHPYDFWVYQEIVTDKRPDVIVEVGNFRGGSALALAHLCDHLGMGRVIAVDINHADVAPEARAHPRITFVTGDAVAVADTVKGLIRAEETVLIIEDSAHTYDNTLQVLRAYCDLIKPGFHFIVEDSICWHGLDVGPNPGPYEAIEQFVKENPAFVIDRTFENFVITWNPKGYLTRAA